jgi:peptidoglycan-N-acetylglucosamine deacetylase
MFTYFKIISTAGKKLYPSLLWNFDIKDKFLYLTFDDGPIPSITPWVLQILKGFNAKATFFCIGDNVEKNPEIFNMIIREGHAIGNHSHNHLDGWKTDDEVYVENVLKAEAAMLKLGSASNKSTSLSTAGKKLFRPPYGRIKPGQIKLLKELEYKIVMWDVISGDYDQNRSAGNCLKNVKRYSEPGSILVFHDSLKASENLKKILPEILNFYSAAGYKFRSL